MGKAKGFVYSLARRTTPLRDVLEYKVARVQALEAFGNDESMSSVWVAVAFSFPALQKLSADADLFADAAFRGGLPASSSRLGDPPQGLETWCVGAPGNIPDIFVIVAADWDQDLSREVNDLRLEASSFGLEKIYDETGHDLSFYSDESVTFPAGHEHFGFKDGISQPGIRGVLPNGHFLTERQPDVSQDGPEYSAPGKPLVCLGEFVLGYATQIDVFPRLPGLAIDLAPLPDPAAPSWAKNGSFLVFRRLRQDIKAFKEFSAVLAKKANKTLAQAEAMLVGRWPSGAPLIRTADVDDESQAEPALANAFGYGDDNPPLSLPVDTTGTLCPITAHIRKINPRDNDTDQGAASATLTHRILRRGIPYGRPIMSTGSEEAAADRGLLFLSYQSSISRQFEFLASQWMNSATFPRNPTGQETGMGFDMLVGQGPGTRDRFIYTQTAEGEIRVDTAGFQSKDWVVATGGGYFFAPSLSAMRDVLGAQPFVADAQAKPSPLITAEAASVPDCSAPSI
jgi:Dyp-type peroxidase family